MYQNFKISKYTKISIKRILPYVELNIINRNIIVSYPLTIVTTNDIILQVTTKCNTITVER